MLLQDSTQLLELCGHEIVVVIIPRVTGDAVIGIRRVFALKITEANDDDAPCPRKHDARIRAPLNVACHPSHVAMFAIGNPLRIELAVCSG